MQILLTGNLFHGYEYDIKSALEDLGHKVDLLFNNIHGPFHFRDIRTISSWLKYGLLPEKLNVNYFVSSSVNHYNKLLQTKIKAGKYDVLLVVGGKTISNETLSNFKGRKVFWFLDGLPRYPLIHPKLPYFDNIFVFEPTDVEYLREHFNLSAKFLSVGFNPKRFFRVNNQSQKYDFSFVGSYYPKRDQYLSSISEITDNFCIYGDFFRSKNKKLRQNNSKINASPSVVNELFNSSKVNINIHHSQSKKGLSPRTFEILGAGGFEIVERQEVGLMYFEENKHLVFYESVEEFQDKCRYYIKHDSERMKIAEAGHKVAIENHTWKNRIQEMFSYL